MSWFVWALSLLLQNASFTLVSRARNSKSLVYHAIAAVCSNGVYIATLGLTINKLIEAKSWPERIVVGAFYTLFTVAGSVGMHHFLQSKVETKLRG